MNLRESWGDASTRTNRVRVVGLVVFVLAGLPLGVLASVLVVAGLDGFTDDPAWNVRLWCLAAVVSLGVSLRTLLVMPRQTPRERFVGLCAALLGVLTAAPTALFPWPWGLAGIALVITGVMLAVELTKQLREDPAGASPTGCGAAPSLDDEGAVEADGHRDVEAVG